MWDAEQRKVASDLEANTDASVWERVSRDLEANSDDAVANRVARDLARGETPWREWAVTFDNLSLDENGNFSGSAWVTEDSETSFEDFRS